VRIKDAQFRVVVGLGQLEGLAVRDAAGGERRHAWVSKNVALLWSERHHFLAWVAPPRGESRLPEERRASRPRRRTLAGADADAAAALWQKWAPGPSARANFDTEQVQDVPLTGAWSRLGVGVAIDYRSDKFNRRRHVVPYRHPFDTPPEVEVMQGEGYEVWVVSGPNLRVTARGIEG
jgi:hypothetical protein